MHTEPVPHSCRLTLGRGDNTSEFAKPKRICSIAATSSSELGWRGGRPRRAAPRNGQAAGGLRGSGTHPARDLVVVLGHPLRRADRRVAGGPIDRAPGRPRDGHASPPRRPRSRVAVSGAPITIVTQRLDDLVAPEADGRDDDQRHLPKGFAAYVGRLVVRSAGKEVESGVAADAALRVRLSSSALPRAPPHRASGSR